MEIAEKLKKLGFNPSMLSSEVDLGKLELARVIAEHKQLYRVKTTLREYFAKVTGKQMRAATSREDYPAVGDFVAIEILDNDQAAIRELLPRKNAISKMKGNERKTIAANIDIAFIVESVNRDYNLNRLERYCALCLQEKIKPVVLLSKTDLISSDELEIRLREINNRLRGYEAIPCSVLPHGGIDKIKAVIQPGMTYCFLGSSGVGKSSIINKLIGRDMIRTREIGEHAERGKHTTTHREMFFLENGGILIDNPGMREVGLADFERGVEAVFDDITTLAKECKFADCTHISEPGCAVLEALAAGRLDQDQYENYLVIKKEVDHFEMSEQEKRDKDRKFGKFVKKSLKRMEEFE